MIPESKRAAVSECIFLFSVLAAILTIALLSSCGIVSREVAKFTSYDKQCIEGVSYLQFTSGAVVQVDQSGKPVRCP